jgi:hypothetical protein
MDKFTTAYIECALWSSSEYDEEGNNGTPLDDWATVDDLAPETLAEMEADCRAFQAECSELLTAENCLTRGDWEERAGHDFWLTRCGHGAGFWDGDWSEPAGRKLTEAAKVYGNVDLYVGGDGRIYST